MVDERREQPDGADAEASEDVPVVVSADPPTGSPQRGRTAWLAVAGLLVVAALAVGAVVVTGSGDDPAGGAAKLALFDSRQVAIAVANMEAGGSGGSAGPQIEYRLVGDLADLGSSATVYRQVPLTVTQDQAQGWATTLGVAVPVEAAAWGWSASDGAGQLWIEQDEAGGYRFQYDNSATSSGSFSSNGTTVTTVIDADAFAEGTEPHRGSDDLVTPLPARPPAAPVDVPDVTTAEQIARDLLADLGVVDGEWSYEATDGAVSMAACFPGAECNAQPQVWSRTVVATRQLDGVPVGHQFWNVVVGSGGAVEMVSGVLAEFEAAGDYSLIPTQQAFDDLAAGVATLVSPGFGLVTSAVSAMDGASSSPGTTYPSSGPVTTLASLPSDGSSTSSSSAPGSSGSGTSGSGISGSVGTAEPAPDLPHEAMPLEAPVIEVSGVELGLAPMRGEVDGVTTRYLVPTYQFMGHYDGYRLMPAEAQDLRQELVVAQVLALDGSSFTLLPPPDDTAIAPSVGPDAPIPDVTEPAMTPGSAGPDHGTGDGRSGTSTETAPPLPPGTATTVPSGSGTGPSTTTTSLAARSSTVTE